MNGGKQERAVQRVEHIATTKSYSSESDSVIVSGSATSKQREEALRTQCNRRHWVDHGRWSLALDLSLRERIEQNGEERDGHEGGRKAKNVDRDGPNSEHDMFVTAHHVLCLQRTATTDGDRANSSHLTPRGAARAVARRPNRPSTLWLGPAAAIANSRPSRS